MSDYLQYLMTSKEQRYLELREYISQEPFFDALFDDLTDYGHDVVFTYFCGAGAYVPFAVSTEKLDTPQKQAQFSNGFWKTVEAGHVKAKFRLSYFSAPSLNAHCFLHELMHFYQDMYGAYFLPLLEGGATPAILDAKSEIIAILFNEAWAQTEAIRVSWNLAQEGRDLGWRGALQSKDWGALARSYETGRGQGMSEKAACVECFTNWYEGRHRAFYERHALSVHKKNLKRYGDIRQENLRTLALSDLLAKIPKEGIAEYFSDLDLSNPIFTDIKTQSVRRDVDALVGQYGQAQNTDVQDIKCGSPSYIWNRLRIHAQNNADHPPLHLSGGQIIS